MNETANESKNSRMKQYLLHKSSLILLLIATVAILLRIALPILIPYHFDITLPASTILISIFIILEIQILFLAKESLSTKAKRTAVLIATSSLIFTGIIYAQQASDRIFLWHRKGEMMKFANNIKGQNMLKRFGIEDVEVKPNMIYFIMNENSDNCWGYVYSTVPIQDYPYCNEAKAEQISNNWTIWYK